MLFWLKKGFSYEHIVRLENLDSSRICSEEEICLLFAPHPPKKKKKTQ